MHAAHGASPDWTEKGYIGNCAKMGAAEKDRKRGSSRARLDCPYDSTHILAACDSLMACTLHVIEPPYIFVSPIPSWVSLREAGVTYTWESNFVNILRRGLGKMKYPP